MKQQKLFTCSDIQHEGEDIQGFCLNLGCQDSRSQFCLQCCVDPMKHTNCKKDLKGFGYISSFITKFNQNIIDQTTQLDKSFAQVKKKYEEVSKQLGKMKIKLFQISQYLSEQDYQQMKDNLQVIKEVYQYFNNQEDIIKQNQIGTQLQVNIIDLTIIINNKKMIEASDLDKIQQQTQGIDDQRTLQQGLQLKSMKMISNNTQLIQMAVANELLIQNTKYLEKNYHLQRSFKVLLKFKIKFRYFFIISLFNCYYNRNELTRKRYNYERISEKDQQQLVQRFIGGYRFRTQEKYIKCFHFNCKKLLKSNILNRLCINMYLKYIKNCKRRQEISISNLIM